MSDGPNHVLVPGKVIPSHIDGLAVQCKSCPDGEDEVCHNTGNGSFSRGSNEQEGKKEDAGETSSYNCGDSVVKREGAALTVCQLQRDTGSRESACRDDTPADLQLLSVGRLWAGKAVKIFYTDRCETVHVRC